MSDPDQQTIRVLFFSVLQDAVGGQSEHEIVHREDLNVAGLLEICYERWPELSKWDLQIRVAIDLEYVGREAPVHAGCEVAVMPPVQGG